MTQYWFIDFDETLVQSAYSWGMKVAFPALLQRNDLPFDKDKTEKAMNAVLEQSTDRSNPLHLATMLFQELDWPSELVSEIMYEFRNNYEPSLFDDAIPFLEQLRGIDATISIISNNVQASQLLKYLAIDSYFDHVFTPANCKKCRPKPQLDLWNKVKQTIEDINIHNCYMVGNDPRTDGVFADRIGMACWLIDRDKPAKLDLKSSDYWQVSSLLEILVH